MHKFTFEKIRHGAKHLPTFFPNSVHAEWNDSCTGLYKNSKRNSRVLSFYSDDPGLFTKHVQTVTTGEL